MIEENVAGGRTQKRQPQKRQQFDGVSGQRGEIDQSASQEVRNVPPNEDVEVQDSEKQRCHEESDDDAPSIERS